MQRVAPYFISHRNNWGLKIKTSNLLYVEFVFLHLLSVSLIQLQCNCNTAVSQHLQLKNKLSHAQPASPQPNMQENTIKQHIYAFAAYELFVAMLACSCTVAAAHTASRSRQALPSRNPNKNLTQHKFIIKQIKLRLLHLRLTYVHSHPSHLACLRVLVTCR